MVRPAPTQLNDNSEIIALVIRGSASFAVTIAGANMVRRLLMTTFSRQGTPAGLEVTDTCPPPALIKKANGIVLQVGGRKKTAISPADMENGLPGAGRLTSRESRAEL